MLEVWLSPPCFCMGLISDNIIHSIGRWRLCECFHVGLTTFSPMLLIQSRPQRVLAFDSCCETITPRSQLFNVCRSTQVCQWLQSCSVRVPQATYFFCEKLSAAADEDSTPGFDIFRFIQSTCFNFVFVSMMPILNCWLLLWRRVRVDYSLSRSNPIPILRHTLEEVRFLNVIKHY